MKDADDRSLLFVSINDVYQVSLSENTKSLYTKDGASVKRTIKNGVLEIEHNTDDKTGLNELILPIIYNVI